MFRVPLLCLPLCTDGLSNAVMVARNRLGLYITREELSGGRLHEVAEEMVMRREEFIQNIDRAVQIITNGPQSAQDVIVFYVDQLVKYGNLDYLRNEVVLEQSVVEMYNVDIWVGIAAGLCGILVLVCVPICRRRKVKRD